MQRALSMRSMGCAQPFYTASRAIAMMLSIAFDGCVCLRRRSDILKGSFVAVIMGWVPKSPFTSSMYDEENLVAGA